MPETPKGREYHIAGWGHPHVGGTVRDWTEVKSEKDLPPGRGYYQIGSPLLAIRIENERDADEPLWVTVVGPWDDPDDIGQSIDGEIDYYGFEG